MSAEIVSALGSVLSSASSGVSSLFNRLDAYQNFRENAYWRQKEWDYNLAQNEITRQREDTAIQRQVADAEAAGLSKFAVAGNNGASSQAVSASSRNNAPSYKSDPSLMADVYASLKNTAMKEKLNNASIAEIDAQTEKTKNEAEYIKNQSDALNIRKEIYTIQKEREQLENIYKKGLITKQDYDNELKLLELRLYQKYGWVPKSSIGKTVWDAGVVLDNSLGGILSNYYTWSEGISPDEYR